MTACLYGIPNCDTMKKARAWLDAQGVACRFHDYRRDGVPADALRGWVDLLGWEVVLNRAGTTFRKLPEAERGGLDADRAVALMLAHPAAIRRPILDTGTTVEAGFRPERYATLFG